MTVARSVLIAVVVAIASSSAMAQATPKNVTELGLDLVNWSKKIDDRRYISGRNWEGTMKHFRDLYRGNRGAIRWSREVSLPTVKYVHIESLVDSTPWQGVNVYQLKSGEVRLFVLPRAKPAATSAPVPAATPAKP